MDSKYVLPVVLYVEIFEFHEHLSHVYILKMFVLWFLILHICVEVPTVDYRDLENTVRIVRMMDGYFVYSLTRHMKRLS